MSGEPSHVEIGVHDIERAERFYGTLLGWEFERTGKGSRIATGGVGGGLHSDGEPSAIVFFSVPDLDAATRRVVELGGEVGPGAGDGPGGRYAYSCRDDQGVTFGLHEPAGQ